MFVLVLVLLFPGETIEARAQNMGQFDNFAECFRARESLTTALFGMPDGYYPPGSQGVCIPLAPPTE